MLKHGILIVFLLPVLSPLFARGQLQEPTKAQYKAAVRRVVTEAPQWRKVIDSVKVDDLPINYAVGKQFQQTKDLAAGSLNMTLQWANRMEGEDSLFDDVNFMSSIQDLQSQLQQFSDLLNEFDMTDKASQKKVSDWSQVLAAVADGPVQEIWKTSFSYTTRHALQVDQGCGRVPAGQALGAERPAPVVAAVR
jgi:hypothetical protein